MKILQKLSDKVLPTLFWVCIMLAFDSPAICILTLSAAAIHEIGHILFAVLIKRGDISLPRATLFGLKIDTGRLLSYKEEAIIAAGGPLVNLGVFLLSLPFFSLNEYVSLVGMINLFTAVTNLLPMRGYDGGRIIRAVLLSRYNIGIVDTVSSILTLLTAASLSVISLIVIMLVGEGYWIFAFFFSVLLSEILARH